MNQEAVAGTAGCATWAAAQADLARRVPSRSMFVFELLFHSHVVVTSPHVGTGR